MDATRRQFLSSGMLAGFGLAVAGVGGSALLSGCHSAPDPVFVAASPAIAALNVLPRARWTTQGPLSRDMEPMNGIHHITVHHDGMATDFTNFDQTVRRLENIRQFHTGTLPQAIEQRNWSDIGYHFVIDRAGRIWEGRHLGHQGAHVKDWNAHNLGISCLGNFDLQQPSPAQLATLAAAIAAFRECYRVPAANLRTHREWPSSTLCPGAHLQRKMVSFRQTGAMDLTADAA